MQSTYTGVYAKGGPTAVDNPKDLAGITNRKPANNRGVALPSRRDQLTARVGGTGGHSALLPGASNGYTPRRFSTGAPRSGGPGSLASAGGQQSFMSGISAGLGAGAATTPLPPAGTASTGVNMLSPGQSMLSGTPRTSRHASNAGSAANAAGTVIVSPFLTEHVSGWENLSPLKRTFIAYALFGKGHSADSVVPKDVRMDSHAFAKLIKEAGLMHKGLDSTRVDLCFTKSADKVRMQGLVMWSVAAALRVLWKQTGVVAVCACMQARQLC